MGRVAQALHEGSRARELVKLFPKFSLFHCRRLRSLLMSLAILGVKNSAEDSLDTSRRASYFPTTAHLKQATVQDSTFIHAGAWIKHPIL